MINLGINCVDGSRNIGGLPCSVVEGQETGHLAVPKGWKLSVSETFDKAYVDEKILKGEFFVIPSAFGAVSETAEATTETSPLQKMSVVTRGLPVVTTTLKNGYEFHSSVYTKNSNGKFDIIPMYETGYVKVVLTKDGFFIKGFDAGMYEVSPYQQANGTVSAQTVIKYQLTDNYEVNVLGMFLTDLDFNPNTDLSNIVDLIFTGRADVSDQKIYIKAVWARNPLYNFQGLASANLNLTVSGVDDTIVGALVYNPSTNEYAITPTATLTTSTPCVVSTKNASPSADVAVVGSIFVKATSNTITPVA